MGPLRTFLASLVSLFGLLNLALVKQLAKAVPAWLKAYKPFPVSGEVRAYLERMAAPTIDLVEPIWEGLLTKFGPMEAWGDDPQLSLIMGQMETDPVGARAQLYAIVEDAADQANMKLDPATIALLVDAFFKLLSWIKERRKPTPTPTPNPVPAI